jgi:DNA helicase-2/ATP-dependent DNA helicase PcrA
VAGAGTGKTTVITERINYLITQKNIGPEEILALTFTEKAAAEMAERVDKALPLGYVDLWISTFHAFAERILKEHGLEIGLTTDFKLLNQTEAWLLVRNNLDKFELDYYRPLGNPNKFIHALLKHFSKAKDEMVEPADYLKYAESYRLDNDLRKDEEAASEVRRLEEVAGAYHVYQQLLLNNDFLDFGDLINYCHQLFIKRPKILKQYQKQFKYILVDEFQDTNFAQYQLIKLLSEVNQNITVVGDDDQCLPPASKVFTPQGYKKIKDFKKGDKILTAVGKGHIGVSKVSQVLKNTKPVKLLTITTKKGYQVKVTDNHKMFCHVPSAAKAGNYFYVYLMFRQGLGWRLGITRNLSWRLSLERSADKILGLKACNSEQEARYFEQLFSLKYSIPTVCFKARGNCSFKENDLKRLYGQLDVESGVIKLAQDLNIDLTESHVTLTGVTRGKKERIKINLEICHRNHRSKEHVKNRKEIIQNNSVQHLVYLQTSNKKIIEILENSGFKLTKARLGKRFRMVSSDLVNLGKIVKKLESLTGGIVENKAKIGRLNYQTLPSVVLPAKNLLLGHYLPVKNKNEIFYDEIIAIKAESKKMKVYDLEVEKTHNFIAEGVVVHNSIYKFRGASISNILEFKKDYPKTEEVYLTANYRTKQNILDSAYKFIQFNNPNRLEVQLRAKNEERGAKVKKLSKELKSALSGQGIVEHLHLPTAEAEVAAVVNKIGELGKKENDWNNFAILVRANNQARPFTEGLERAGIPYQFVASKGLYAKPVILNLVAFLKLLDDYHESDAMYRYLTMPVFKLEQSEIIKITHLAYKKRWTLFETARQARALLKLEQQSFQELDRAVGLLEKYISQTKHEKTSRIIFDFLNESGFLKHVDSLSELDKRQQFSYLGQFYKRIKAFEEVNEDTTVKNFLRQLGLELESGEQGDIQPLSEEEGPEMVKVMTVHGAKGLEFKYVFLVNLVDLRFPTTERSEPIELPDQLVKEIIPEGDIHLQEERRLFYVAITRAKEGVFFTSAEDYGGVRKKKISVFLKDLGFKQPEKSKAAVKEKLESVEKVEIKDQRSKISYPLPTRFSYTQIKDFQNCPRLYYYRYILKVPLRGSHYFSFGSTIHLALQRFYEEVKRRQGSSQGNLFSGTTKDERRKTNSIRDLVSLEELLKIYQEVWIDDWYQSKSQKDDYFKQGRENLKMFYQSPYLEESRPSYLEKGFSIKINGHTLGGKIDRIDEVKGGWKIIDYKTGRPKEKLSPEDREQLLIYQMATNSLMDGEVKELAYYYLENGTQVPFTGTKEEIAKLQEKIIKTIGEIEKFDFDQYLQSHEKCMYCEEII